MQNPLLQAKNWRALEAPSGSPLAVWMSVPFSWESRLQKQKRKSKGTGELTSVNSTQNFCPE
jgi:hypothetical protein